MLTKKKTKKFSSFYQKLFQNGTIISASDASVTSLSYEDVTLLCPTDHEEAHTRLLVHVNDIGHKGLKSVIRTVNTDVLNLALSFF